MNYLDSWLVSGRNFVSSKTILSSHFEKNGFARTTESSLGSSKCKRYSFNIVKILGSNLTACGSAIGKIHFTDYYYNTSASRNTRK